MISTCAKTGRCFLVWDTERSTKTRDGSNPAGHNRDYNPKAIEIRGHARCPVRIFEKSINKRPASMSGDDTPLFLGCRANISFASDPVWYTERPMGKNLLGNILSEAAKVLPQQNSSRRVNAQKVSNHSAGKQPPPLY